MICFFTMQPCNNKLQSSIIGLLLFFSPTAFSQQLSIKAFPGDYVYVFEESRKDSIFNVLIHNIGITNNNAGEVQLEKVVIDFYKKAKIFQQNIFFIEDILKSSSDLYQLQQNNQLDKYDFMFHTKDLLGTAKLSGSRVLQKESGLILRKLFFTLTSFPDSIQITVTTRNNKGPGKAILNLGTKNYTSDNNFILPVSGSWYAAAGPSAHTHHRWAYMEEFAYDLVQLGANNLTYKDDYTNAENYFCYGKDVLAVAAGEVIAVMDSIDDAKLYPKDLPQEEYMKFVRARQSELIKKYGVLGVSGNIVLLKHGEKEYTFYGHLKKGSVTVKPGQKISQGHVIAQIGNSGNSTEPHLHFQMNEGSSILNSRSIPIKFANLNWSESFEPEGAYIKSGDWVRTK
ncbi:MAG: M23 family metallopeptidase [Chitinophagaceae bacterium]